MSHTYGTNQRPFGCSVITKPNIPELLKAADCQTRESCSGLCREQHEPTA
jgi:hypothetical protein